MTIYGHVARAALPLTMQRGELLLYLMSGGAASGVDGDGYVGKGIQGFTVTLCLKERRCAGRIAFSER